MKRFLSVLLLLVVTIVGVAVGQSYGPSSSWATQLQQQQPYPYATTFTAPAIPYFNQYPASTINPTYNMNMPITASAGMYPMFGSINSSPIPPVESVDSAAGNYGFHTSSASTVSAQQIMTPPTNAHGSELSYQQSQEYANWQHQQELQRRSIGESHPTPIDHPSTSPSAIASSAPINPYDSMHGSQPNEPKPKKEVDKTSTHVNQQSVSSSSTAHLNPIPRPSSSHSTSSHSTTQLYTPGIKGPFGPFGPFGPGGPFGPFGPGGPKK